MHIYIYTIHDGGKIKADYQLSIVDWICIYILPITYYDIESQSSYLLMFCFLGLPSVVFKNRT